MKMTVPEWNKHISSQIQGGFFEQDMVVQREEIEKLKDDEIYLEIGVDEGKSLCTARYYAKDTVWTIGVDMTDPPARAPFMNMPFGYSPQGQALVSPNKKFIYIHADANMMAQLWTKPISLLFIDGDHSYEGVKSDTLNWEKHVKKGGTILFHDYDSLPVKEWIDEYYGKKAEILHNKVVRVRK